MEKEKLRELENEVAISTDHIQRLNNELDDKEEMIKNLNAKKSILQRETQNGRNVARSSWRGAQREFEKVQKEFEKAQGEFEKAQREE